MKHRTIVQNRLIKLTASFIAHLLLPFILFKLAANYILFGIAILTPVPWNDEEEQLLRKALWRGQRPRQLRFTLWRRESEIVAKAKELELL